MKKKILISAAVAGLSIAPALTAITSCSIKDNINEVHIINVNDFHGAAPGYGDADFELTNIANPGAIRLASEFEDIKAKYPGSVVIAGGDLNAGEGFSTCAHGNTFYPVLSAMDIRYSTVGNHAWEWGSEPLETYHIDSLARTKNTVGNYFFTSNVLNGSQYRKKTWSSDPSSFAFKADYELWKQVRVPWADPFKLLDLNGHIVCLIGLTTKDTLSDGNMESMKTLSFMDYSAAVTYSKMYCYEAIGEEEFNKIDAFILDTHLECQALDSKKPFEGVIGEAATLAKTINTRIDGIFAAHSHMICSGLVHNDALNIDIPVAQGGQAGRRYVDAALVFDDSKPAGKRLKSLTMNVVTPKIEGTEDPKHPDIAKAAKQIAHIIETTPYNVVKNTNKVYQQQKQVALRNLTTVIGNIQLVQFDQKDPPSTNSNEKTVYGCPYWYMDNSMEAGTKFRQSKTILEPAGVWANIAMIDSFNRHYDQWIEAGYCYPAAVAFTNIDSLKSGFTFTSPAAPTEILKKQVYQMHAFENNVHYGCLTIDQLEQYINYILDGGNGKFDYGNKTKYATDLYLTTPHTEENKIVWDANETCNDNEQTHPLGTSYTAGLVQYHGLAFEVEKGAGDDEKGYVYTLKPGTLKIYDPSLDETTSQPKCDIYDPTTWIDASNWSAFNGYVPIIVASFAWQGGNKQNRMLHHWFDYNAKNDPLAGHLIFDMYTRGTALEYIDYLTAKGWKVNQVGDNTYIDEAYVGKFLKLPA